MGRMDDLVQWLRAQLDEDERIARAAQRQHGGGEWAARADASGIVAVEGLPVRADEPIPVVLHPDEDETSVHVAEHDPARVLREIDAKRKLLRQYEHLKYDVMPDDMSGVLTLEAILRAHAAVYNARPGYCEEWRP
jgi:hypothetical protein